MVPGHPWRVSRGVVFLLLGLVATASAEPPSAPPSAPPAAPPNEPAAESPRIAIEVEIAAAGGRVFYGVPESDRAIVEVVFMGSQVTPEVLAALADPLAKLPHLRKLTLASNAIRDDDLRSLASLQQIEDLQLNCDLTGAGVAHLANLRGLTSLGFFCSEQLTDTALIQIRSLPRLKRLRLAYTPRITDTGLKLLRTLPALEELTLRSTAVTPEGLDVLKEFPALKRVSLAGRAADPFTPKRLRQLSAELPGCEVTN